LRLELKGHLFAIVSELPISKIAFSRIKFSNKSVDNFEARCLEFKGWWRLNK